MYTVTMDILCVNTHIYILFLMYKIADLIFLSF